EQHSAQVRKESVCFTGDDAVDPWKRPQRLYTHLTLAVCAAHHQDSVWTQLTNLLEQGERGAMLLKYRTTTNDARILRNDDVREAIHVGDTLSPHPAHQIFSLFKLGRKTGTPHFKHEIEILLVLRFGGGKQVARKAPFTQQVIGRRRLHRLVSDQSDPLG